MSIFSRMRSRSRRSKEAETNDATVAPPAAQVQSKRKVLTKAQSQPGSRSNSMNRLSMISHPAYANTNIFGTEQSYLPVPQIPTQLQKDRASADKAARTLGVDPRTIQSAPVSPKLHPRSIRSEDNPASRHDSVNSNVERPRVSRSNSKVATFSDEELALEPTLSESGPSENSFRRSMSSAAPNHERKLSHDSFRPTNVRRHTMHQDGRMFQQNVQRPEQSQRGRSHQQMPSYSMPTHADRSSMQPEPEHFSQVTRTLPGAHQPQAYGPEHGAPSSPFVRPQQDVFAQERHYSPAPPLSRRVSQHSNANAITPPLALLDGLKINKRGRILDEEGDPIGELVEGDLIDCVRQRVNGFGEVLDEYGRVVGRVRTLVGALGLSTPAFNHSTPTLVNNRNADYFDLPSQSPMLTPSLDTTSHRHSMQHDDRQKYRILMDAPPVPSMPRAFQGGLQTSTPPSNGRYSPATFESFDGTHCAELPAEHSDNEYEEFDDVPAFDLSEPFMPVPSAKPSPTEEKPSGPAVMEDAPRSPVVPIKSRQRGLSLSQPEATEPAAEESPEDTVDQSVTSAAEEDHFEEAEPYLNAVHVAAIEPAKQTPVVQAPQPEPVFFRARPQPETTSKPAEPVTESKPEQTRRSSMKQEPAKRAAAAAALTQPYPRPILASRVRSAPSTTKSTPMAPPPLPRAETMPETQPVSALTSGYNSAEESFSEAESIEIQTVQRKEVRISNLPPTTIPPPARQLNRSLSNGAGLGRFSNMPSVPESEPLSDSSDKPFVSNTRAFGARSSAPLPAFPRQSFGSSSLPSSPFAAANAAANTNMSMQKRMSMPGKFGVPPVAARAALAARPNRFTMNAPLVPSPLSDRRQTMSHVKTASISSQSSECTPSGSDNGKSDAISIMSTTGKPRTYFTHGGRVTVEAGDLPPSLQKKEETVVEVTAIDDATEKKKKNRFSMKFGKKNNAVAAH